MNRRLGIDRHLVCLTPEVPYEGIDHAGGDYLFAYLSIAADCGWRVTVIAPDTRDTRRSRNYRPAWLEVMLSPRDLVPRGLGSLRLLRHGANAMGPSRWLRRLSAEAKAALRSADIVDLQWMGAVQYAEAVRSLVPGTPVLATPHDVKSESIARAAEAGGRLPLRLGAKAALPAVRRAERRALDKCDRVFVFKEQDVASLRAIGVSVATLTAPPLVRFPNPAPAPDSASSTLLFSAAFWREENDEAARWFLKEIWPTVAALNPRARVRFAGSRPSAWLRGQASDRVEVTGYLSDLMDAYWGVGLVIAPLRRGAGLKFKVAQAMAMGFPVVATSVALEGIDDLVGNHVLDAVDDPQAFAEAVLAGLQNLSSLLASAAEAAGAMRSRLDFRTNMHAQIGGYDELLGCRG